MVILGIDPGSIICGYGVIESSGNDFKLVEYGVVKAQKKYKSLNMRLKEIFLRLNSVIERTNPDVAALETMFYSKNVQSLIKLSHARGVAVLSATLHEIPMSEYSPKEIKKSVTGRGSAGKEQVQFMVRKLLSIEETPEFYDSTDALAVAICHFMKSRLPGAGSGGSWKDFIKNNPDRVSGM